MATLVAFYGNFLATGPLFTRERSKSNEHFELLGEVNREFSTSGDCFLVIESPTLFDPKTYAALRRVAVAVESVDSVESVITLDRVPVFDSLGMPGRLMPRDGASPKAFQAGRQRALAHPLVVGQLLSEDAQTMVLSVILHPWRDPAATEEDTADEAGSEVKIETGSDIAPPEKAQTDEDTTSTGNTISQATPPPKQQPPSRAENKLLVGQLNEAVQAALGDSDLSVRLTGRIPLFVEQNETFDREKIKFSLIGYTLVFVLAALIFRGLAAVLIVSGACGLGLFWTIGVLFLIGEDMNPLTSVILPVMLVMVGFTDGVHIMVDIRRSRAAGVEPIEASRRAALHLGMACALTSLTTAIGFGSLMIAETELIRSFGRSCAIGVGLMFVSVVTVIPLLSSTRLGRNVHQGQEHDLVHRNMTRLEGMMSWITRHATPVATGGTLLTLALAILAVTMLRPDNRIENDFSPSSRAYQALTRCDSALGGIQFIQVVVDWPEGVQAHSPELIETLSQVDQLLEDETLVRYPLSILNVLEALPGLEGNLPQRVQWLKLLPDGVIERFMNTQTRRAVVTARIQDLGTARYEPVFQNLETELAALESLRPGYHLRLSGDPVVTGRSLHQIITDLAKSLGVAAVIIFVVMGLVFRSLRIGLISVVPNLFPLAVTATMLVAMGRPLEISSVCAFTICLGIAVDDTIHFLTRFRRELAIDGDVEGPSCAASSVSVRP